MKWTAFILSICFLSQFACSNEPAKTNKPDDTESSIEVLPDPAKVAAIDQYRQEIRKDNLNKKLVKQRVKPHFFSDKDSGLVLRDSGEIVRAGFRFIQDTLEEMTVFHFMGGKLVHVDHREWHKSGAPYAIQVLAYFDKNEKIFQVSKRHMNLEPGENPGRVVNEPPADDSANADSLTRAFKAKWVRIAKVVEADK